MQFVDNGMFALSLNESGVINDIGSDKDDDEIIGATSADGMPLTRDNALIEHMSEVGLVLEDEYVDINDDLKTKGVMLLVVSLHPKDMFTLVSWSLFASVPHQNTLQGH
jgi:hypothetical protein